MGLDPRAGAFHFTIRRGGPLLSPVYDYSLENQRVRTGQLNDWLKSQRTGLQIAWVEDT